MLVVFFVRNFLLKFCPNMMGDPTPLPPNHTTLLHPLSQSLAIAILLPFTDFSKGGLNGEGEGWKGGGLQNLTTLKTKTKNAPQRGNYMKPPEHPCLY